jgi:serine/threonine-protein kinase
MYYYGRDKRRRAKKRLKQGLIAFALIGILAVSYFLFVNDSSDNVAAVDPVENSLQARKILAGDGLTGDEKDGNATNSRFASSNRDGYEEPVIPRNSNTRPVAAGSGEREKQFSAGKVAKNSRESFYEVKSVAHFYNEPNERARRKEVIEYWNHSNASIKPITQKNDFIYIEFTYPSGETTKGWLRKKDLKKVNTVYGNNKD